MALGDKINAVASGAQDAALFDETLFEEGHCHAPIYLSTVDMYVGGHDDDDYLAAGTVVAAVKWMDGAKKYLMQRRIDALTKKAEELYKRAERENLIGNDREAIRFYMEALDIWKDLAGKAPGEPSYHRKAALLAEQIGDIFVSKQETAKALKLFNDAWTHINRTGGDKTEMLRVRFKLSYVAGIVLEKELYDNIWTAKTAMENGQLAMSERALSNALRTRKQMEDYGLKTDRFMSPEAVEQLKGLAEMSKTIRSPVSHIFSAMILELTGSPETAEAEYATAANEFLGEARDAVSHGDAERATKALTGAKALAANKMKQGLIDEELVRQTWVEIEKLKNGGVSAATTVVTTMREEAKFEKPPVEMASFGSSPTLLAVPGAIPPDAIQSGTDPLKGDSPAAKLAKAELAAGAGERFATEVDLVLGDMGGTKTKLDRPGKNGEDAARTEAIRKVRAGVEEAKKVVEKEGKPK